MVGAIRRQARGVVLAWLVVIGVAVSPAMMAQAADNALWTKAAQAHEVLWREFIDPRTFQVYTYLDPATGRVSLPSPADIAACRPSTGGWGTAIENCALDGGAYLGALVDRHAVTGEAEHAEEARRIYQGLRLIAASARRRGCIPRGVLPDGVTHYPESSVDQYTMYVYGLWRYFRSPIATKGEKGEIQAIFEAVLERLEADKFVILSDTGQKMKFGALDAWRSSRAERLLAVVLAGADVTGKAHWREVYDTLRPPRLAHCRAEGGEPWVLVQNQLALFLLRRLEKDPEALKVYEAGSLEVARVCATYYDPGKKMLASRVGNRMEGSLAIALSEDKTLIAEHLDAIRRVVLKFDVKARSVNSLRALQCIVWSLARQGFVAPQ